MAAIASINGRQQGAFAAAPTVLTADDTIAFDIKRRQLLVLRNPTGASVTATVDGAGATTAAVSGLGSVNVAGGYAIPVPAGATRSVVLGTISLYCVGAVHITGGAGLEATVYDL